MGSKNVSWRTYCLISAITFSVLLVIIGLIAWLNNVVQPSPAEYAKISIETTGTARTTIEVEETTSIEEVELEQVAEPVVEPVEETAKTPIYGDDKSRPIYELVPIYGEVPITTTVVWSKCSRCSQKLSPASVEGLYAHCDVAHGGAVDGMFHGSDEVVTYTQTMIGNERKLVGYEQKIVGYK